MEKKQIYEKLNENMQNLETIDNEIAMVELAIYEKKIEKVKEQKREEIRNFFEQQAIYYRQKSQKYQLEIEKNMEKYEELIEKLTNSYHNLYIQLFQIMQNAKNNQKIAIANIVTLTEKLNETEMTEKEIQNINNNRIACAQKKLNYAVLIDECQARIQWCIQNVEKDINEIFVENRYQLQIYQENIVNKIRRIISNKILGKSKYKRFLENYETEEIRKMKVKNSEKILEIMATLKGILKQTEAVKKEIAIKYHQMVTS